MKLHIGKMTNKELAEWFGVKEGTFKSAKKKKLEELKHFAAFHEEKGKVIIEDIFIEEYSKNGSKAFQMVKDELDKTWSKDGLDSCSHVGMKIGENLKDELALTPSTIYTYTRKSRNELYGVPFQEGGKLGSCVYLWCKKEGDGINAKYTKLTDEEEVLKQQLIKKYFGDATEKQIIVQGMVEMGEIKREEAWEVLEELTGMKGDKFKFFLAELQSKLGCQVIRGTLVDRYENRMIEEK